jgi:hypothetical protein
MLGAAAHHEQQQYTRPQWRHKNHGTEHDVCDLGRERQVARGATKLVRPLWVADEILVVGVHRKFGARMSRFAKFGYRAGYQKTSL